MNFYLFFSFLLIYFKEMKAEVEWIDPFSLDGSPIRLPEDQTCECDQIADIDFKTLSSYYRRNLNLLLNILVYDIESKSFKSKLSIDLLSDDYNVLKNFAKHPSFNVEALNEIDRLLTNVFTPSATENLATMFISWKEYFIYTMFQREVAATAAVCLLGILLYYLLKGSLSFRSLLRFFILFLYIIDYVFTWMCLIQKKEVEQMFKLKYDVPEECDPSKMGWLDYAKHTLGRDKCQEYYENININIHWTVTPGMVVGEQLSNWFLFPAEKIGLAFSAFINGILKNVAWYSTIPIIICIPFILLVVLFGVCIIISFIIGTSFEINCFHLFKFKFGMNNEAPPPPPSPVKQIPADSPEQMIKVKVKVIKGTNANDSDDKIEEITNRVAIEDANSSDEEKKAKKGESSNIESH